MVGGVGPPLGQCLLLLGIEGDDAKRSISHPSWARRGGTEPWLLFVSTALQEVPPSATENGNRNEAPGFSRGCRRDTMASPRSSQTDRPSFSSPARSRLTSAAETPSSFGPSLACACATPACEPPFCLLRLPPGLFASSRDDCNSGRFERFPRATLEPQCGPHHLTRVLWGSRWHLPVDPPVPTPWGRCTESEPLVRPSTHERTQHLPAAQSTYDHSKHVICHVCRWANSTSAASRHCS